MGLLDRLLSTAQRTLAEKMNSEANGISAAQRLLDEGAALEQQGNPDKALKNYDAALRLAPSLARAHFYRGNLLLDLGDAKQALLAYTKAIQLKPDSAATFYNMGNAHMQLAEPIEAVAAYTKALELKPDFPDARVALDVASQLEAGGVNGFFSRALAMHDSGQLDEAKKLYQRTLSIQPAHVDACNNLGTLLAAEGLCEEAVGLYLQALIADPASFGVYLNLAVALQSLARPKEAVESLLQAVAIRPDDAGANNQLGEAMLKACRTDEAAAYFGRAFELEPTNANYVFSHGLTLQAVKKYENAAQCYRQAIALKPDFAEAYCNLGAIERQLGNIAPAVAYFEQAIALKPDFADVFCNLANAQQAAGKLDAAEQNYRKALSLKPDFAIAHCNYGTIFQSRGLLDVAKEKYLEAIRLDPNLHDAYTNLGVVLNNTRQFEESIFNFHRALAIKPDFAPAHVNLGNVLKDTGQVAESLASFRQALAIDPKHLQARNNLLFVLNYLNDQPGELMLSEAKVFGETVTQMAKAYATWGVEKNPEKPLRIGFVSGDLCSHPVGYFLVGVLRALAQNSSESLKLYAYLTRTCDDETSKRIRSFCAGWKSAVGLSDAELAHQIHTDNIDILFDLSGHTANSRLPVFAWKPAPVQISWLGYFATTGVAEIDYFIADPWTLPESQENFFTEKIWRLPETRLCFTAPEASTDVSPLPAIANGYVTFGCFNNLTKMNDAVVDVWARILRASPGSKLFLKSQQIGEATQMEKLLVRFYQQGIAADRLILEDYGPREQYLAAYRRVDIGLDPFPYPGGTTTVEALWMGIPVLTLAGESFIARQGVGLLMNAGLAEWVASDVDDYVQKALAHSSDIFSLAILRTSLRQQVLASPVFDANRFALHFEEALRTMWRTWCNASLSQLQPINGEFHESV